MKRCPACGERKELSCFSVNNAKRDGRQSECKPCRNKQNRARLRANPALRSMNEANAEDRRRKTVWEHLLSHPCVDCGESDPLVLEFDHVRGVKVGDVCVLIRSAISRKRLLDEIAKCDVRCCNCHRRVTRIRRQDWRALMASA